MFVILSVEDGYDPSKARGKAKGAKKVPDLFGKPGVDITTTKVEVVVGCGEPNSPSARTYFLVHQSLARSASL